MVSYVIVRIHNCLEVVMHFGGCCGVVVECFVIVAQQILHNYFCCKMNFVEGIN
jgi:hypothetical protein